MPCLQKLETSISCRSADLAAIYGVETKAFVKTRKELSLHRLLKEREPPELKAEWLDGTGIFRAFEPAR